MTATPSLSIVTPSYNTGAFIEQTLRSVAEQGYGDVEHIVLDSGSTDETPEILARFPSVRVVEGPRTLAEKVRLGFELAQGELVAWINADDYYLPGAFEKAAAAFAAHDVGMVYCNVLNVDEHGAELERRRARAFDLRRLVDGPNYISHPTVFLRADAVRGVGGVDVRWPTALDFDLHLRVGRDYGAHWADDYWAAFRVRKGQMSDRRADVVWFEIRALTRHHGGSLVSELFLRHYAAKLGRAATLARNGDTAGLGRKLAKNAWLIARHSGRRR